MHVSIIQTLLLMLVTALIPMDWMMGSNLISRPIVTGTLTGLILGNMQTGIIMGATIELAFIGAISTGASRPPDIIAGGVLGTAFAIVTGKGVGFAITLAFPVAALYLIIDNVLTLLILPFFLKLGDKYADQGNVKKLNRMNLYSFLAVKSIPRALFVGASFYLGSSIMVKLLNMIPQFVQDGITIAAGIMPALGFALLLQMILKKNVAIYFVLGFALYAYLKIPVLGISIFAFVLAFIIINLQTQIEKSKSNNSNPNGDENNDF